MNLFFGIGAVHGDCAKASSRLILAYLEVFADG